VLPGVGHTEEFDKLWEDVLDGRFAPDHRISDAMNALNVWRNGYVRIDQLLKRRSLMAVEAKADRANLDQPVHNREQAGGFGVERHKGDVGAM
jgi:hypothetical protein